MEQKQSIWCFLHKDDAMDSPPGIQAQSCLLLGVHHEAQSTHMHPRSDEHTKESTGWVITEGPMFTRCHHNSGSNPGEGVLSTQFWLEFCAERTDVKWADSYQGMTQKVHFPGCLRVRSDSCRLFSDHNTVQWQLMPRRVDWQEGRTGCASESSETIVCLKPLSVLCWM